MSNQDGVRNVFSFDNIEDRICKQGRFRFQRVLGRTDEPNKRGRCSMDDAKHCDPMALGQGINGWKCRHRMAVAPDDAVNGSPWRPELDKIEMAILMNSDFTTGIPIRRAIGKGEGLAIESRTQSIGEVSHEADGDNDGLNRKIGAEETQGTGRNASLAERLFDPAIGQLANSGRRNQQEESR